MNPTTYRLQSTHTTTTTTTPQPTAHSRKKKTKNKKCWSAPITQPPIDEPNHLPMLIYPHKKCWLAMTLTMKWEWMSLRDRRVERVREWETGVERVRYRRPELREWEIGDRSWERWALEMRRWDESEWERKREWRYHGMYYLNHRGIKIIFF